MTKTPEQFKRFVLTLKELGACPEARRWVQRQKNMENVLTCEAYDWAIWLVAALMPATASRILHKVLLISLKTVERRRFDKEEWQKLSFRRLVAVVHGKQPVWGKLGGPYFASRFLDGLSTASFRATYAHLTIKHVLIDLSHTSHTKVHNTVTSMVLTSGRTALKRYLKKAALHSRGKQKEA
jgi:hypothetical protein